MNMGGKLQAQAALTPGKNVPLLVAYGAWSGPEVVWALRKEKNLFPLQTTLS